jgi:ribulose 1,5-bisphosphate synthetase/thiazole synthase
MSSASESPKVLIVRVASIASANGGTFEMDLTLTVLYNSQVGAGPSGLVLALTMRRNGIPVRIIEKTTEHRKGQRGAGIMVCGRSINSTAVLFFT